MAIKIMHGFPFHPYNPKTKRPFRFLEVPLIIMDGTLWNYMGVSAKDLSRFMIRFIEEHQKDCLISILWHNTSLTDFPYPGLTAAYLELLAYADKANLEFVELDEISQTFAE